MHDAIAGSPFGLLNNFPVLIKKNLRLSSTSSNLWILLFLTGQECQRPAIMEKGGPKNENKRCRY